LPLAHIPKMSDIASIRLILIFTAAGQLSFVQPPLADTRVRK
jgi:hypothetical protein